MDGATESADPGVVSATVNSIVARDPAFNLDAFLAESHQAFWLVGQAHAKCQPDLCQSVLSADLAERERALIDEACSRGPNRAPEGDDASTGQLVSIVTDANRDTATVHFRSVWRLVAGSGDEEHRAQNWCFQRSATSLTQIGVESDRCQNCGASLQASAGTCRYCGTRIGDESGWRVIRIDDVSQPEAASAVAAMRDAIAAIATEHAAAQRLQRRAPMAPRTSVGGWIKRVFWLVVLIAAVGAFASFSDGPVHRAVGKVVPAVKFPLLKGPLTLDGRISTSPVTATAAEPLFRRGAACSKAAVRTSWDFKAKLPDGSSFHLTVGLPPASGGPGTYNRPRVSVEAEAKNSSATLAWSATSATTADLIIRPDGGGELTFKNLVAADGPLNGHVSWTCALG